METEASFINLRPKKNASDQVGSFRYYHTVRLYSSLGTLVALPWLDHAHDDDGNDDKEDENSNAHPFP